MFLLKAKNLFDFIAGCIKAEEDCYRLAKAQKEGILALSLPCWLEIDGEHLDWCSFYWRGDARPLLATVAPPSGGGLCLKSETEILQAPTLPTPVSNTKGNSKSNRLLNYVQIHWASNCLRVACLCSTVWNNIAHSKEFARNQGTLRSLLNEQLA